MRIVYILFFILFVLMLLFGGERGAKSFITLVCNVFIGAISIFLLLIGVSPYLIIFVSSLVFCLVTIKFQNGLNIKTVSSLISVLMVCIFSCIIIYIFSIKGHIGGFNEIEMQEEEVFFLGSAVEFKMVNILMVAFVWGQLGAVIDTSMAISSSLHEIFIHNPDYSKRKLIYEGAVIGKDILGTTVNTLSFVFLGESLMLFIYYRTYVYSINTIINSSSFFQEIFSLLLSCIGCLIIIPLTSFIYAIICRNKKVHNFIAKFSEE